MQFSLEPCLQRMCICTYAWESATHPSPGPRGPEAGVWAMETLPLGQWAQLAGCKAGPLGGSWAPGAVTPLSSGSTRCWQQKPQPEKEEPQFAILTSRSSLSNVSPLWSFFQSLSNPFFLFCQMVEDSVPSTDPESRWN